MPLRDHFHAPVNDRHWWDELHSMWPMMLVRQLFGLLPEGYRAAPSVYAGCEIEPRWIFKKTPALAQLKTDIESDIPVVLTSMPEPTLTLESDLSEQDEFEVRIFDNEQGRKLVAAIEIVSPSNKNRPENRRAFIAKIAALLQKDVCVSVVDLVTIRQFNLYSALLDFLGQQDPQLGQNPSHLYSVTIRSRKRIEKRPLLDLWYYPMTLGQTLPTLPIWLDSERSVLLPLEPSYEETCRLLHIS